MISIASSNRSTESIAESASSLKMLLWRESFGAPVMALPMP